MIRNMTEFVTLVIEKRLGGEGSGFFGHAGRPGEVGGSSSEGAGDVSFTGKSYDEIKVSISALGREEQGKILEKNVANEDVVYVSALYGHPVIRERAIEIVKDQFPKLYEDLKRDSIDVWASSGKEQFLDKFYSVHAGDVRGVWTAQMQEAMAKIGPNAFGEERKNFFATGVHSPEPSQKVVGYLQDEYSRTQSLLKNAPDKMVLYRADALGKDVPMTSWTSDKAVAAKFAKHYGRTVVTAKIPKERIFATYQTIRGWDESAVKGKKEFIVLGLGLYRGLPR